MRKVQTDFISQLGKTRENLQLSDDTVSSQAVMIKQDSASFADSSCHSSPVGSVLFKNGFFPDKMLISRALHRSIAVFNSPVILAQTFTALTVCSIDARQVRVRVARNKCTQPERCKTFSPFRRCHRGAPRRELTNYLLSEFAHQRRKGCDGEDTAATPPDDIVAAASSPSVPFSNPRPF